MSLFAFFSHIQIKMPDDFLQWHESMCAEFPTRFNRLFRGPMWSGVDENYYGYPIMVSTDNYYIFIVHCYGH
jgi:hypothetical protein